MAIPYLNIWQAFSDLRLALQLGYRQTLGEISRFVPDSMRQVPRAPAASTRITRVVITTSNQPVSFWESRQNAK
jgi:hypothetical protein